jgi:hypothetical protein
MIFEQPKIGGGMAKPKMKMGKGMAKKLKGMGPVGQFHPPLAGELKYGVYELSARNKRRLKAKNGKKN